MSEHVVHVNADAFGDGVYLTCTCGWQNVGYDLVTVEQIVADAAAHRSEGR